MIDGCRMGRGDWWKTHKYKRRTIKHDFDRFCGWEVLKDLVNKVDQTTSNLVCGIFETGGRISEVLTLTPNHFDVVWEPEKEGIDPHVLVRKMLVVKRKRRKNGTIKHSSRTFPIPLKDPLIQPLLEYVETLKPDERLYPWSYSWAYKRIRDIDKPVTGEPKHGPWWCHRFRAERATQLVKEEGFKVFDLMAWFGWIKAQTAVEYVELEPIDLIEKISRGII